MPAPDKQLGIRIMREFTKRASIDASQVLIHAAGGIVYFNGKVKPMRGAEHLDLRHEIGIIERSVRTIPGVRDVVNELDLPR